MLWIQRWWLQLQTLFRRERSAQQLDEELQFHLEQQIAENVAAGMSEKEARLAAVRIFGNTTALKEETRDTWGWVTLEQIAQDLRYGFRSLRKSPLFTAVAVSTLALGIGANTAIFSLMDQVLLQLLPVKHPEQLVLVAERGIRFGIAGATTTSRIRCTAIFAMAIRSSPACSAVIPTSISLGYGDHTESVAAELVSGSYFPALGVTAAAGRTLTPRRRPHSRRPSRSDAQLQFLAEPLFLRSSIVGGKRSSSTDTPSR